MPYLNFIKASSVGEALELLNGLGSKAAPIAGGTDLMVERRQQGLCASHVIDISGLAELKPITLEGQNIRVGAGVTHAMAQKDELLREHAPMLAEACSQVGSPQIRNRATIGGNIMTAASCADTLPPLAALQAVCTLRSAAGQREVPICELVQGGNLTGRRPDELLMEIYFPLPPAGCRQHFIKLIRRNAFAKSRLSLAAIALQNPVKSVDLLHLAVGSATPAPLVCERACDLLRSQAVTLELLEQAAELVCQQMVEISGVRWSTEYKKPALEALAVRILAEVLEV